MKRAIQITTLFLDVGGVLLTEGWDHHGRRRAATNFKLEWTGDSQLEVESGRNVERESAGGKRRVPKLN